jgi:hypothetical protein
MKILTYKGIIGAPGIKKPAGYKPAGLLNQPFNKPILNL